MSPTTPKHPSDIRPVPDKLVVDLLQFSPSIAPSFDKVYGEGAAEKYRFTNINTLPDFMGDNWDNTNDVMYGGMARNSFRGAILEHSKHHKTNPVYRYENGSSDDPNTQEFRNKNIQKVWSTKAHNVLVQNAFNKDLVDEEIALIQNGSLIVDSKDDAHSTASANEHAMLKPGQSVEEGMQGISKFINDTLDEARILAAKGDKNAALIKFSEATHAIMDRASPAHKDENEIPNEWHGIISPKSWFQGHSLIDGRGIEGTKYLTPEIKALQRRLINKAYDRVFGTRHPGGLMEKDKEIKE